MYEPSILIVLINFKCYFKCVNSTYVVIFIYFHVFNVLECFSIGKKNPILIAQSKSISDNPVFRMIRFRIIGGLLYISCILKIHIFIFIENSYFYFRYTGSAFRSMENGMKFCLSLLRGFAQ